MLEQPGVDEEAIPAALQEVKDQAFGAVEKAAPQDIAIQPVQNGTPKERRASVDVLSEPPPSLYRVTSKRAVDAVARRAARQHLLCFQFRPTRVPPCPGQEVRGEHIRIV